MGYFIGAADGYGRRAAANSDRQCHRGIALMAESSNTANCRLRYDWWDLMLRISRGDWTPLELFVAGVRGWEGHLRKQVRNGSPFLE
jgi:hypothetical protein